MSAPQTTTASDVLRKAADLIEPEGAWTQSSFARSRTKRRVGPLSPKATCWCVMGALLKASSDGDDEALDQAGELLTAIVPADSIVEWNDAPSRTQAEVVAALRAAADQVAS